MSRSAPTNGSESSEPSGPQSEHIHRRALVARNPHQRIEAATARAIAAHGFQDTTVEHICIEAEISQETFREHFKDKQEAAMSALETSADQVMTDLREVFKMAATWPEAIWDSTGAVLEWMVHEPAFTRLAVVEMLSAGEAGLELLQSLMDAFAMFLEPGYELLAEKTSSKRLVDEAVANAVFGLLYEHISREGTEALPDLRPELVRTILTSFVGAEKAAAFVAERRAQD